MASISNWQAEAEDVSVEVTVTWRECGHEAEDVKRRNR